MEKSNKNSGKDRKLPGERLTALNIVSRTMTDGEMFDHVLHETLKKYSGYTQQEKNFITRLSKGTVERAIELDYVMDLCLSDSSIRIKPVVKNILRTGIYQIMYMDAVPDSAAVNESVKLTVVKKCPQLKGFVNGVLRTVARINGNIPYPDPEKDRVLYISVKYSVPQWIVKYFLNEYGDETEDIFSVMYRSQGETSVRVIKSKISIEECRKMLLEDGVQVKSGRLFPDALRIRNCGNPENLRAFREGFIQIQDESTMLDAMAAGAREGMEVLDICAAPGGKSIDIADDMAGTGKVTACDISKQKVSLIRENLIRLGMHNVKLKKNDALIFREEFKEAFDIVICDLPCTGLGVMGKKPDIKYRTQREDIASMQKKQRDILKNAVKYVRPGGILIYSTCTLTYEENSSNCEWLEDNMKMEPVSLEDILPDMLKDDTGDMGYIQVMPDVTGTDGFFIAKFRAPGGESL